MDFTKLAKTYDTPLFVYDFHEIKKNYDNLKNEFLARKSLICYALKANTNLSVIKFLAKLGSGFDCVSINEVKKALYVNANKYQIIFSGVGKSDEEIKEAILLDILMINIESMAEFLRVEEIAKSLNKIARISVRVNPNVDAKTHEYISTGLEKNKFGVDIQTAKQIYIKAKNSEFINPIGVHFHIGSQLSDVEPIIEASKIVSDFVRALKSLQIDIKFFDIGGGIGVRYKDEKNLNLYEYAQGILKNLSLLDVTILLEPGRFLVANAGYLITKVLYEKQTSKKRFVIVDAAMNDLIRPSLYNAYHEIVALNEGEETLCDVVGPICESGDFLAKDIKLPQTKSGDLLVVKSAGAYSFSMSSNYNSRLRAAEVGVYGEQIKLIRRREKFEDLIAQEVIWDTL